MQTSSVRTLLGMILLAIGSILLLDRLELISIDGIFSYAFPLVIIILGVLSYMSNPRAFLMPSILIVFGTLMLLKAMSLITVSVWHIFLPILIMTVGISLIFRGPGEKKREESSNRLDSTALFSGLDIKNVSQDFQGGAITAVFGGTDINLSQGDIQHSATLEVFVAFGGITIVVPEHWNVTFSGLPIFGGMDDKTRKIGGDDAPTLHLRGTCLFGGVDIKN